jgi:acyl-CoA hydrolase
VRFFNTTKMTYKRMTAEEAAQLIENGDVIGFSGFTAAGCPKAITQEVAKKAEVLHVEGKPFQLGI